jgi:exodeoxyribonuclease VII large subunit
VSADLFSAAANARALEARAVAGGGWTVSEVNAAARELLETSLPPLWVLGEVASWKRVAKGHCFFTLKDARSELRCAMWRDDAARLPAEPVVGMEVRCFGYLTIYERGGDYQLVVRELEARGPGLWRLAFEKVRDRLAREGWLDPARKRPLPRFPRAVGVVTSTDGAALRDIVAVIRRRAPWVDIVVRGTRVQGEGAAEEIAAAVRALAGSGLVDVCIVGRGGGSPEDLWVFNDERVARAIAEAPVPTISAVGHEIDVTIADLVADHRAPTPSAAAECAVPDRAALARELETCGARMRAALRRHLDALRARADRERAALARAFAARLDARRRELDALARRLDALSPLAVLRRGYAVPIGPDGRVLRGVEAFRPGLEFELRVHRGRVRSRVLETRPEPDTAGPGETNERR